MHWHAELTMQLRQLAHVPDDEVRAAYNRAAYLPERRQMLQAWADWLDQCAACL